MRRPKRYERVNELFSIVGFAAITSIAQIGPTYPAPGRMADQCNFPQWFRCRRKRSLGIPQRIFVNFCATAKFEYPPRITPKILIAIYQIVRKFWYENLRIICRIQDFAPVVAVGLVQFVLHTLEIFQTSGDARHMTDREVDPLEHRSHAPPSQARKPMPIGHRDHHGGNAETVEHLR